MDADPAVTSEFDILSRVLPLPFRVGIIIVAGIWGWGLNLQYLEHVGIDVPALIRYPPRSSSRQPSHHTSTYRFATLLTIPLVVSLAFFWLLTRARLDLVTQWQLLPNAYLLFLIVAFFVPVRRVAQDGRNRFLTTLRRVSIGGIAETSDGKFGDILMGDVLTSYAKVLGDIYVVLCMLFTRQKTTAFPDRDCGGTYIVPILISVPSFIRFRQCVIEYLRVRRSMRDGMRESTGWGGQHLANALKYASALPVVIFSALQHSSPKNTSLFHLWLFFVFVNSFYSFYWDVMKDWDLTLLSLQPRKRSPPYHPFKNQPEYPFGLRRPLLFPQPSIYYCVIFMDLLLRCSWSFKLSPHLDHFSDLEGGIYVLELLEVFRRWVWVFFRVETESIRGMNKGAPEADDVLLAELGAKFEDD